jgi:N-acetylmuramoyl-L-alanine amidase
MNQPHVCGFDHLTMAKTVWGEARNQGYLGMAAVAWVVKNRATRGGWWGESIASVCQKPSQFSCWNSNDPNRAQLDRVTEDTPEYLRAIGISALVMTDDIADPTGGGQYYHTKQIHPAWADKMIKLCEIGDHVFYKEKGS